MQLWIFPWIGVIAYPGLLRAFDAAINRYQGAGNPAMAAFAVLAMLLAMSVPILAARALLNMRHEAGPALTRGILYVIVGAPSLFTLTLTRLAGLQRRRHWRLDLRMAGDWPDAVSQQGIKLIDIACTASRRFHLKA